MRVLQVDVSTVTVIDGIPGNPCYKESLPVNEEIDDAQRKEYEAGMLDRLKGKYKEETLVLHFTYANKKR